MSFFQFTGNISPEEYKKTLEDVANLQEQYQDRVDISAGINRKSKPSFSIGTRSARNNFLKKQDDDPALVDESKSYIDIKNNLLRLPIIDKIAYIFDEHQELIPKVQSMDTFDFAKIESGSEFFIGSEDFLITFLDKSKMTITDTQGFVQFPPDFRIKQRGLTLEVANRLNKFYVYGQTREDDYVDLSSSYNGVFSNLLLFDNEVLDHFNLLEGAEIDDLGSYLELVKIANAEILPVTEKIQKVQALLAKGPQPKIKEKKERKLPRKPSEIEKLKPQQRTFVRRAQATGLDDNMGVQAEDEQLDQQPDEESNVSMSSTDDSGYSDPTNKGSSVKPKRPRTSRGLAPNSSYIIQGSKFGNLDVDVPLLFNRLHLKVHKGGELIVDEPVDRDTLDLLTHRIKPGKLYSKKAEKMLTKMISNSNYELHPNSQKLKIAQNRISRKREKKYAKKKGESYDEPELSRLITLTSEIAAGNYPNSELLTEIRNIANGLYKVGKIDSTLYRELKNKYGLH